MEKSQINLASLLSLMDLRTQVDVFCRLSKGFAFEHDALNQGAYFHLILKGNCFLCANNQEKIALTAGDFCLWTDTSVHWIVSGSNSKSTVEAHQHGLRQRVSGNDIHMLCGSFVAQNAAAIEILKMMPTPLVVSLKGVRQLEMLADLIREEAMAGKEGCIKVITALCEVLLLFAFRQLEHTQEESLLPLFADKGLARVAAKILSNPAARYSIETLAQTANLSRATFIRRFSKATGMTVQAFVRLLRLSKAAQVLREERYLSIGQVAEIAGYQSESAFTEAFVKRFGCTPAVFRRQFSEDVI
ncbi:helix-turn-helix domain-containing protein [Suttonella ornithocola]|nr:AraC family transcriptional regulator [Suttonella ornithocola]